MRKLIDIDESTLTKLKVISIFEKTSVKGLIENAVQTYVKNKQTSQFSNLSDEEKEDMGLLMLMQEADRNEKVSEEEIFRILGK
jgi:predicted transcriptional regulator